MNTEKPCDRCGQVVVPPFVRDSERPDIQSGGAYRASVGVVCVVCANILTGQGETVTRA